MNFESPQERDDTIRLRRPPPRVFTEARGQTVWMGDVEALELELEDDEVANDPYNSANDTLG